MKSIPVTKGKLALVDDEDYDRINKFKWRLSVMHGNEYAQCHTPMINRRRTTLLMHRLVMGACKGQEIDHRDRNGLNNQKSNLRFCTRSQNNANRGKIRSRTGFKGVRFVEKATLAPWNARISVGYKLINLGYFTTPQAAALAYNNAARQRFGEYSKQNTI